MFGNTVARGSHFRTNYSASTFFTPFPPICRPDTHSPDMNVQALIRDIATPQPTEIRHSHIQALPSATQTHRAPMTMEAVYAQYSRYVERVLSRVMGVESNLPDILQDVHVAILSNIHTVRDSNHLKSWITSLTIFTARQRIRTRMRRRAVWVDKNEELEAVPGKCVDPEAREALLLVQHILKSMDEDEAIAFTLRYIEGLEHREAAKVCGVSLATAKRRVSRAREHFNAVIHQYPLLEKWIREGNRWHPVTATSV